MNRALSINDLGVTFDSNLRFNMHVELKVNSAMKILGFTIRSSKCLNNIESIKLLFNAFVRANLEYASEVWSPYYARYSVSIENVQRKFLKYIYYKKNKVYPPQGYPHPDLLTEFGVQSLHLRRKFSDLKFLNKVLTNALEIDTIYFNICLSSNRSSNRHPSLFTTPRACTNLLLNSPIVRMCYLGNKCAQYINIGDIKPKMLNNFIENNNMASILGSI